MVVTYRILLSFRHFIIQALRHGLPRKGFRWLWKVVTFYAEALWSKLKPPSPRSPEIAASIPPKCTGPTPPEKWEASHGRQKGALTSGIDYMPIANGATVPLQGFMPSVYPHAGDDMHDTAGPPKILDAAPHSTTSLKSTLFSPPPFNDSQFAASNHSNVGSHISTNILEPPPGDAEEIFHPDSESDPDQAQDLQPTISASQALFSPLTLQTDGVLIAHDDKDSGPAFLHQNYGDTEIHCSLNPRGQSVRSGDLPTNPSHPNHPDSERPVMAVNTQAGYKTDESSNRPLYPIEKDLSTNTSQLAFPMVLGSLIIVPIMPEAIPRYTNRPIISRSSSHLMKQIPPLKKVFDSPTPPNDWQKCVHPEGACYFYNPTKMVYAEANLHDETTYTCAMKTITTIENFIKFHDIKGIDNAELVIYVSKDSCGRLSTLYYYVHHETRSIFFLDMYALNNLSAWHEICGGAVSESHLGVEIEAQYWYHCQSFPHSSALTKEKVQELRDMVVHYIGDTITSPKFTTAPYSLEELRNILQLTDDMDKGIGGMSIGSHSSFARFMYILTRAKFLHFYGEPHARIDRTTSVYGDDVYRRTWLVKIVSPILFCAPDIHLDDLQSMWVDQIVQKSGFREMMERMNSNWDRTVLFATVLLNANVALLTIQSVDNIGTHVRSATQIASYMSIIASVGSIVIGLLLSRQNRVKLHENVDEFERYISDQHRRSFGLETLAILYSLPYALLMWCMVFFFLAVAFLCFKASDVRTASTVGVSYFICVVLVFCSAYTNWDEGGNKGNASETIGGRLYAFMAGHLSFLTLGRYH